MIQVESHGPLLVKIFKVEGMKKCSVLSALVPQAQCVKEECKSVYWLNIIYLKFYDIRLSEDTEHRWPIEDITYISIERNVHPPSSSFKVVVGHKLFRSMNCFAAFSTVSNYGKNIKFLMKMVSHQESNRKALDTFCGIKSVKERPYQSLN